MKDQLPCYGWVTLDRSLHVCELQLSPWKAVLARAMSQTMNGHRVLPAEPGTRHPGKRPCAGRTEDEKHLRRGEGEDDSSDFAAEDPEAHRATRGHATRRTGSSPTPGACLSPKRLFLQLHSAALRNPGPRPSSAPRSPHLLSLKAPCVPCSRGLAPSPGRGGPDVTGRPGLTRLLRPIFPRAPASHLLFPIILSEAPLYPR